MDRTAHKDHLLITRLHVDHSLRPDTHPGQELGTTGKLGTTLSPSALPYDRVPNRLTGPDRPPLRHMAKTLVVLFSLLHDDILRHTPLSTRCEGMFAVGDADRATSCRRRSNRAPEQLCRCHERLFVHRHTHRVGRSYGRPSTGTITSAWRTLGGTINASIFLSFLLFLPHSLSSFPL